MDESEVVHLVPRLRRGGCLVDTDVERGAVLGYVKLQGDGLQRCHVASSGAAHLVAQQSLLVAAEEVLVAQSRCVVVGCVHVHRQSVTASWQCDGLAQHCLLADVGIPNAEDVSAVGGLWVACAATHVDARPCGVDVACPTLHVVLETGVHDVLAGDVLRLLGAELVAQDDRGLAAVILHDGRVRLAVCVAGSAQRVDHDDAERALGEHTLETVAASCADGKRLALVVPVHRYLGVGAVLVVVVVVLVLVESEVAVGAWVDAYLQVIPLLLGAVLHVGSPWQDASSLDVERDDVEVCLLGVGGAALQCLAGPEVNPLCAGWQIVVGDGLALVYHRAHQHGVAEHILELLVAALLVAGECQRQCRHQSAVVLAHLPAEAVEVGQHAVAHPDVFQHLGVVSVGVALLTKLPYLAVVAAAVEAHHAGEGRELGPAQVEVAVVVVVEGAVATPLVAYEEGTVVVVPVGDAAGGEVESGWNLLLQCLPRCADVTAPGLCGIALLTYESASCKDADTLAGELFVACLQGAVMVVDAADVAQHETVAHGAPRASVLAYVVQFRVALLLVVGLGGVHPVGIHALAHQSLVEVFPVDVAGCGAPHVVWLYALVPWVAVGWNHASQRLQFLEGRSLVSEVAPDGDEQVCVVGVHVVNHLLIVAEVGLVEEVERVPVAVVVLLAPVLPVLHHAVYGHLSLAVLAYHVHRLGCRTVALLALVESEVPQRHERSLAREPSCQCHHVVGRVASQDVVVNLRTRTLEVCSLGIVAPCGGRVVVPEDAISLGRLEEGDAHLHVVLLKQDGLVALVQVAVLYLSQTVHALVAVQCEGGSYGVGVVWGDAAALLHHGAARLLSDEWSAVGTQCRDVSVLAADAYRHVLAAHLDVALAAHAVVCQRDALVVVLYDRHAQLVDGCQCGMALQHAHHLIIIKEDVGVQLVLGDVQTALNALHTAHAHGDAGCQQHVLQPAQHLVCLAVAGGCQCSLALACLVQGLCQLLAGACLQFPLCFAYPCVYPAGNLAGQRLGGVAQSVPCAGVECCHAVLLQVVDVADGAGAGAACQSECVDECGTVRTDGYWFLGEVHVRAHHLVLGNVPHHDGGAVVGVERHGRRLLRTFVGTVEPPHITVGGRCGFQVCALHHVVLLVAQHEVPAVDLRLVHLEGDVVGAAGGDGQRVGRGIVAECRLRGAVVVGADIVLRPECVTLLRICHCHAQQRQNEQQCFSCFHLF